MIRFCGSSNLARLSIVGVSHARYPASEEHRFAGYHAAFAAHGIAADAGLVALGRYFVADEGHDPNEVTDLVHRLLLRVPRPTAIFAAADTLAAATFQGIHALRLRVPDDISVIAFDNTFAPWLTLPLTAMEQPVIALGETAIRIALVGGTADGAGTVLKAVALPMRLVRRSSTGIPPQ